MGHSSPRLGLRTALQSLPEGMTLFGKDAALRGLVLKGSALAGVAFLVFVSGSLWGVWKLSAIISGSALLVWVARVASIFATLLLAPVIFTIASGIVMPFYRSRIFARARTLAGADPIEDLSMFGEMKVILVELRRLARLLLFVVLLLPLHLVPIIGSIVYAVAALLLAANSYGWDLLGYHFELHQISYQEQKRWLRANRLAVMALGMVATLLCLIPIAQIFFINSNSAAAGVLSAKLSGGQGDTSVQA